MWFPKKASTAFTKNQFVDLVSGFVQPSTSSSAQIFGLNQDNTISSGSTTTVKIPVLVPRANGVVRATATNTLASTSVGNEFDLSDSQTVDQNASTTDAVKCVGFVSATEGLFTLNQPDVQ
jgi:hypothetical protein